jgi:hypothetical protein
MGQYIVLTGKDASLLAESVLNSMLLGFMPFGGVSVAMGPNGLIFAQAMMRNS